MITTARRLRLGADASLVTPAVMPHGIVQQRERRPLRAVMLAAAVFALIAGYVQARGGIVDHTHYAQEPSR